MEVVWIILGALAVVVGLILAIGFWPVALVLAGVALIALNTTEEK